MTQIEGVQGVQETHFWTLSTNVYVGGLKLEVSSNADSKYVISHTQMIFRNAGVEHLVVQLDYEFQPSTYQNLQHFGDQKQHHDHHGHPHEHHHHNHHGHSHS